MIRYLETRLKMPTWEDEVRDLYHREHDMDVADLEALLEVAVRGERPDDPRLPASLPMEMGYELR